MKQFFFSIISFFLLFSCARGGSEHPAEEALYQMKTAQGDVVRSEGNDTTAPDQMAAAGVQIRIKVKNGTMTLVVEDIKTTEESVTALTTRHGGYIALSRILSFSGTLTAKIPEDHFDAFIKELETLGRLESKEIVTEDVSDRYFDLENRIKNKRILLARYQDYLKRAGSTKELLQVESAINQVTTDIESLEGSFRNLQHSVSYSTLRLTVKLPPEKVRTVETPSLLTGLRGAGDFLLAFLYYLLLAILYILIVAVPLTLFGGLVYFVGFGRIGLVVKFFKALGPKKE